MLEVHFHAMLREIVGGRTVELTVEPGQTIRELIAAAIERSPALQAKFFAQDGTLSRYIQIFMNGRNILLMDELDTVIPAGAVINIFPPIAGG